LPTSSSNSNSNSNSSSSMAAMRYRHRINSSVLRRRDSNNLKLGFHNKHHMSHSPGNHSSSKCNNLTQRSHNIHPRLLILLIQRRPLESRRRQTMLCGMGLLLNS